MESSDPRICFDLIVWFRFTLGWCSIHRDHSRRISLSLSDLYPVIRYMPFTVAEILHWLCDLVLIFCCCRAACQSIIHRFRRTNKSSSAESQFDVLSFALNRSCSFRRWNRCCSWWRCRSDERTHRSKCYRCTAAAALGVDHRDDRFHQACLSSSQLMSDLFFVFSFSNQSLTDLYSSPFFVHFLSGQIVVFVRSLMSVYRSNFDFVFHALL